MLAGALTAAARVILDRGIAWALAAAGLALAATALIAVILSWRAVASARAAARLLEELRRAPPPRPPAEAPLVRPSAPPVAPVEVPPPQPTRPPEVPSRIPEALWAEPIDPRTPRPEPPSRPPPSTPPDISRWEVVVPPKRPFRPAPEEPAEERAAPQPPAEMQEPLDPQPPPAPRAQPAAPEPTPTPVPEPRPAPVRPFVESRPPFPGGEETSLLLRALADRDPFVRQRAVAALAGRTEAEGALMDALRDEYPMVRREAVRSLRRAGRSLAVQALVGVVSQDPSAEVREEAVIVLADFLHPGNSKTQG